MYRVEYRRMSCELIGTIYIHEILIQNLINQSPGILLNCRRHTNLPPFLLGQILVPLILMPVLFGTQLKRIMSSGKDARRDGRRRERDTGCGTVTVLQFDVAVGGKQVAFLEDQETSPTGGIARVGWSAVAGVLHVVGSSLTAVSAGVSQGCERRDADADEACGNFGGAP